MVEVPTDYEPLFSIAITETLRRDVTVKAKSKEEVYAQVERLYSNYCKRTRLRSNGGVYELLLEVSK